MNKKPASQSGIFNTRVLIAVALCSIGASLGFLSFASTPSSGTLTDVSGPLNYTAGPFTAANPTPLPQGLDVGPECNNPSQPCDDFALTITLPTGYLALHPNIAAKVTLTWTDTSGQGVSDYDLYIYKGTVINTNGSQAAAHQSATSANPEIATISPLADGSQTFTVKVVPFTPGGETVHVKIELLTGSASGSPGLGGSGPGVPRFFNYVSPPGIADSVGEPSIGSNWKSEKTFSNSMFSIPNGGATLLFGGFSPSLWRNTFDDCSSPAGVFWEANPLLTASTPRAAGDPILFTDHQTGRTFVSQLEGLTPAGSTTDITDDDGNTFTPSEGSGLPSCIDHQTIGGGPFHAPLTGTDPVSPNAVYYASQCVADATASLSLDGGRTFGPGTVMFTTADCGGLHGHLKVAPDGTVYVPDNACGGTADPVGHSDGNQAVIVSEDNGITWSIRKIRGSTTKSAHDNSVGVASDSNTIYVGFQSGDGHPRIAVSHDKGLTWSVPFDVGATVVGGGGPILNTGFAEVVAGDPNRASFAFYGTVTGGNDWNTPGFPGEWYLYVASTFDGGLTWLTQNLTVGDPIQRGGICGAGACRNHLDFFDAALDKEGRVVIGYTDGCVSAGCIAGTAGNDFTAKGTIARQTGGKRMFAANDPVEAAIPGAPLVKGSVNGAKTAVSLSWPAPDNGGSPITAYKISRGPSATGPFTLLATVLGSKNNYTDTTFNPAIQNFYIVPAVNAIGEGPYCGAFQLICAGAIDDVAATQKNQAVVINVRANDNDCGAPPLSVTSVSAPSHGTAIINGNGTVTYTPAAGFFGPDRFTYTIQNGLGATATATVRVTVNALCSLLSTGSFSDNFESGAPGWTIDTAVNLGTASPTWSVIADPNAHSLTHSFFSDATTLDTKDDRLVAPPQNLSSTSQLTFWHRFRFEASATGSGRFDGGVLEVSNDGGATWVDVLAGGGSFVSGGYNGTISTAFGSPIAGRQAWSGGSQTAATDPMTKVVVNLGAFAGLDVRVRFRLACDPLGVGSLPGVGWFIDDVEFTNTSVEGPCPTVVSRKTHGTAGDFDINLPLAGNPGIECRSGGGTNAYTLIYSLDRGVAIPGTATVTQGTATVGAITIGPLPNQITVNLTGVTNAQHLVITLNGMHDGAGAILNNLVARMDVLLGDVNQDGFVLSGDYTATRQKSGAAVDANTFKFDVNADGFILSGDYTTVRKQSGTQLP